MILRRLSQSIKQQNWTAIWIEFILLVVGVFLGIQVANWNEDRTTEKQAKIFTERLRADLLIEAWNYEFMIQYADEVQLNAETTLAVLEGKANASDEQLIISAYRASQFLLPTRRRAAYDQMTSTGTLELVKDKTLLNAAALVYDDGVFMHVFNQVTLGARYREAFRLNMPIEVQSALGEQCGDNFVSVGNYKTMIDSLNYDCVTGLNQDVIDNAANILRSDGSIVPLLRMRISDLKTINGSFVINSQDIRQALKAVVEESQP